MLYEKQLLATIDHLKEVLETQITQNKYSQNEIVRLSKRLDAYLSEYQRYSDLEKRKAEHYRKELFIDPLNR